MAANSAYGIRTHPAEEIYIMLAGKVFWKVGGGEYTPHYAGSRSYHPSYTEHANMTKQTPFMSIYIWRGEVSTTDYVCRIGRDRPGMARYSASYCDFFSLKLRPCGSLWSANSITLHIGGILNHMTTPQLDKNVLHPVDHDRLGTEDKTPVKIALLYGSLRKRSYSRLLSEEAMRILQALGAECRIYNPSGLPLPDDGVDASHPKVAELRDLISWSEGMVWCSP